MSLKYTKNGKILVIEFEGRFDIHQSLDKEKSINELIDKDEKYLLVNLEKTEYLSSSGLRILIAIMRRVKGLNGTLKLANMNNTIRKTFEIVELLDLFEVYSSVQKALESFEIQ